MKAKGENLPNKSDFHGTDTGKYSAVMTVIVLSLKRFNKV